MPQNAFSKHSSFNISRPAYFNFKPITEEYKYLPQPSAINLNLLFAIIIIIIITVIIILHPEMYSIQNCMNNVVASLNKCIKLVNLLNFGKTNFITFCTNIKIDILNIRYDDKTIVVVVIPTFLGLQIDNLNWETCIESIIPNLVSLVVLWLACLLLDPSLQVQTQPR
jgi:hypothetical protein